MNQSVKTAIIIGAVIVAIVIVVPPVLGALSGWQGGGWGMMGPGMMGGFGWGWFMPIFMILFWGLIIWGVVALVRGLGQPRDSDSSKADSALEVLKRRYARGEINKEEYEEKKKDLA
jgi:putative membrane protein